MTMLRKILAQQRDLKMQYDTLHAQVRDSFVISVAKYLH
jgi:hypothetical protein